MKKEHTTKKAHGKKVVLELRNVTKCYGEGKCLLKAVDDASLKIHKGDFLTIIGPSGSGKSTLLHMLGLLDEPSTGEILIDGINTVNLNEPEKAKLRNKKLGFVFQMFNLIPSLTALENVEIPQTILEKDKAEREKVAKKVLEKVGLGERMNHYPNQLSGGEKQRVAIARALSNDPEVIFADEPTGALDSKRGKEIMQLFKDLNKEGRTVVVITHDPSIAKQSKRLVKIRDGKVYD